MRAAPVWPVAKRRVRGIDGTELERRVDNLLDARPAADAQRETDRIDLREHLVELRPEDIADELESFSSEQIRMILLLLPDGIAAQVIAESEKPLARKILEVIDNDRLPGILERLDPDDAADILGELEKPPPETPAAEVVLDQMDEAASEPLRRLLDYPPDCAGGLMTPNYVWVTPAATLDDALEAIRSAAAKAESVAYVYVCEPGGELVGVISVRDVLRHPGSLRLADLMETDVLSLPAATDEEDVAMYFDKHHFKVMPVVDEHDVLLGVVTMDDALDVLSEEAEKDMLAIAGVPLTHQTLEPVITRVGSRLPWLFITLLCGLSIAWIISDFEGLITEFAVLALFQPVILALGGSIGLQSSTIIVRGLAVDEIDARRMWRVAWQELLVGLLIGAACGCAGAILTHPVAAVIGAASVGAWTLGLVIGISVAIGMTLSAMIGTLIPLVLERLQIDPALAAGPFITVLSDCSSLLIYFTVATLLMRTL